MKIRLFIALTFLLQGFNFIVAQSKPTVLPALPSSENPKRWGLAIHGGAGTILKENMTPELEKAYNEKLSEALSIGYKILDKGGAAMDAVEAVIKILEDSPLFNAGKGSVFANNGKNEMDAAIMNGTDLKAGSVAGVRTIKNPISAARAVMEKSPHVMLSGAGADTFALKMGLETVDPKYFYTEKRWQQLLEAINAENKKSSKEKGRIEEIQEPEDKERKRGTVGCVALDKKGNLAAGTSTGGMTNKKYGRIGDAPIIGAGTYAKNSTCAVSCTGHGEYFIRYTVASSVSAMMEYGHKKLKDASTEIISQLEKVGGEGGLISIDYSGNVSMPFNSKGMYRGKWVSGESPEVKIYKE
jgi:L-asparaginase / beta-aspartyl-peptidase